MIVIIKNEVINTSIPFTGERSVFLLAGFLKSKLLLFFKDKFLLSFLLAKLKRNLQYGQIIIPLFNIAPQLKH